MPETSASPAVHVPRPDETPAVLALADRAHAADGHPPLNDQTRAVLARGGQRWWGVTRDADGTLTGAAALVPEAAEDGPGVVELAVDPAHRRAGLGGALAAAAARTRGVSRSRISISAASAVRSSRAGGSGCGASPSCTTSH